MKALDLAAALAGVSAGRVSTAEEDAAAFPRLASFNDGAIYVGRFSGETPWERHPGADELLHVLEGATDVTVLTSEGAVRTRVPAGCAFVVPRGLWHPARAAGGHVARRDAGRVGGVVRGRSPHGVR